MYLCFLLNSTFLNESVPDNRVKSVHRAGTSVGIIVLYSRDHKGVGMAHKKHHPKSQPQLSLTTMKQYWLGKTKPKQAFS